MWVRRARSRVLGSRSDVFRSLLTIPSTICVTSCSRIGTSLFLESQRRMGDLTGFQKSPDYKALMDKEAAIAVLTAMITPAVLISACGSMILSTSSRLGRVVDRVRSLSDRLEDMAAKGERSNTERQASIFQQLDKLTSRARILQRCMVTFYLSLGMFVSTSVAIGVVPFTGSQRYNMIPVALGLTGACFLFYGSVLLILEARLPPPSLPRG